MCGAEINMKGKSRRFSSFVRTAYVICYVIISIILLWQLGQCVKKYLNGTTYYETAVVEQKRASFPDFTICSFTTNGLKEDILKVSRHEIALSLRKISKAPLPYVLFKCKGHGLTSEEYVKGQWTSKEGTVTPQDLWDLATFQLEELILEIRLISWSGSMMKVYDAKDRTKTHIRINILRTKIQGQCYTIRILETLRDLQIKTILIEWYECF